MRINNVGNIGGLIKPPCTRDCVNRKVGCHSACEAYIGYVKRKDAVKEDIRKKQMADADYGRFRKEAIEKIRRSH